MKAAVIVARGGPEGRVVAEHPMPGIGPDDVLIRVRACSLNHLDIFVRNGTAGRHLPLPHISGGDIAGEVAEVGSRVSGTAVGDRVLMDPLLAGYPAMRSCAHQGSLHTSVSGVRILPGNPLIERTTGTSGSTCGRA